MRLEIVKHAVSAKPGQGGLVAWLLGRAQGRLRSSPRLALIERIALSPRQSLALVEAEGLRFLVATADNGAPAFYPLDDRARATRRASAARVSW